MDELEKIFKEQKEFQKLLYDIDKLGFYERVSLSKEYILAAHRELGEVLSILPWKSHRKQLKIGIKKEDLKEELIDVIKFIFNIYLLWGIMPSEFVSSFWNKSKKVRDRLKREAKYVRRNTRIR